VCEEIVRILDIRPKRVRKRGRLKPEDVKDKERGQSLKKQRTGS